MGLKTKEYTHGRYVYEYKSPCICLRKMCNKWRQVAHRLPRYLNKIKDRRGRLAVFYTTDVHTLEERCPKLWPSSPFFLTLYYDQESDCIDCMQTYGTQLGLFLTRGKSVDTDSLYQEILEQNFAWLTQNFETEEKDSSSREDLLDDFDLCEFPPRLQNQESHIEIESGKSPLAVKEFQSLFDSDGRLVHEHHLRRAIFRGGVEDSIRKDVWRFLFNLYPFNSTKREREVILSDHYVKYKALKNRWKQLLVNDGVSSKLLCPGYVEEESYRTSQSPTPGCASDVDVFFSTQKQAVALYEKTSNDMADTPMPDLPSPEVRQQLTFIEIQANLYAARQPVDLGILKSAIRVIDKDVPRTDRELEYFSGIQNKHLHMLRDILITFAAFHPNVNYAQGMNDILSRFIVILDSEVEAYWCFKHFMESKEKDFTEDGLVDKLNVVRKLLHQVDQDLWKYLNMLEIGDMAFCHRWMLLTFKREFSWEKAIRCFEMLSSHHLELSSLEAERIRDEKRRKDFQHNEGEMRLEAEPMNVDFTFDVFMCVAVLVQHRNGLFNCHDSAEVIQFIASLTKQLDLDELMVKAEDLFKKYCHKSVTDCFHVLEPESESKTEINEVKVKSEISDEDLTQLVASL